MKYFLIVILLLLNACATKYLPQEQKFHDKLRNLYESYAYYKYDNDDYDVGNIFIDKANKIKDGYEVELEKIDLLPHFLLGYRSYTDDEMTDFRTRLFFILENKDAKTIYWEKSAEAQFYYDCWIKEEENYTKFGQIARCRRPFLDALEYLEYKLSNLSDDMLIDIKTKRKKSQPPIKPKKIRVYFDFDSSRINERGNKAIWEIIRYVKDKQKYTIKISGHADRMGKVVYNDKLSKRRSDTVKHYLIKNGIPKDRIIIEKWEGELEPTVITDDEFKEFLNRKTDVFILEGDL